jgi:hypothetical protein
MTTPTALTQRASSIPSDVRLSSVFLSLSVIFGATAALAGYLFLRNIGEPLFQAPLLLYAGTGFAVSMIGFIITEQSKTTRTLTDVTTNLFLLFTVCTVFGLCVVTVLDLHGTEAIFGHWGGVIFAHSAWPASFFAIWSLILPFLKR